MNIFNFFKRYKTYRDFLITADILNEKPICYGELFKILGMEDLIQSLCVQGKYHYKNIRASNNTIKLFFILSILQHNVTNAINFTLF